MKLSRQEMEVRILAHLVSSKRAVATALRMGIVREHFAWVEEGATENYHSFLYGMIIDYYERSGGSLVTTLVLENQIVDSEYPDAQRGNLLRLWARLEEETCDENELFDLLKQLQKDMALRLFQQLHTDGAHLVADEGLPEWLTFASAKINAIRHELIDGDKLSHVMEVTESADFFLSEYTKRREHPELYQGIHCGLAPIDEMTMGWMPGQVIVLLAPTGGGKCLGYDTRVLRFDGLTVAAQDVVVGDLLMGPDSRPRKVLSVCSGREPLYRVIPIKGDSFVVNESHILSLKLTNGGKHEPPRTVNISVRDYLNSTVTFRHRAKTWRTGVEFSSQPVYLNPYILGLWLGDTYRRRPSITNADEEVVRAMKVFADAESLMFTPFNPKGRACSYYMGNGKHRGSNPMMNALRDYDLIENKHIPHAYLANSREVRLELLAGLVDSDGYYTGKGYDFVFKSKVLAEGVAYLCRSLGFAAYVRARKATCTNNGVTGTYYRIHISGDLSVVPARVERKKAATRRQKKNVLVTGMRIEPIGDEDYYGFNIDQDGLFLLSDFTVTHNSVQMLNWARFAHAMGKNVLYFTFEMTRWLCLLRHLALEFEVPFSDLKGIRLSPDDAAKVAERIRGLQGGPYFEYRENIDNARPSYIEASILEVTQQRGAAPDLVVVDYLGNMRTDAPRKDAKDWEQEEGALVELHKMALRHNLPILTAQQVNREGVKEARKAKEGGKLGRYGQDSAAGGQRVMYYSTYVILMEPDQENNKVVYICIKGRDTSFEPFSAYWNASINRVEAHTDNENYDYMMTRGLSPQIREPRSSGLPTVTKDEAGNDRLEWESGVVDTYSSDDLDVGSLDEW